MSRHDEDKIVLRFFRVMPDAFEIPVDRAAQYLFVNSDEGFREWVVARTIIDPFDIVAKIPQSHLNRFGIVEEFRHNEEYLHFSTPPCRRT